MRIILLAAATLALTTATAAAAVNIIDNDVKLTVDCAKEKTINIVGNNATVTLTGTCQDVNISGNEATIKGSVAHVSISGNENKLVLDAVDSIMISGDKNTITYKKPVKAKKTSALDSGSDNKVSQVK